MKGIVFSTFFEMIEEEFGFDMVDHLIEHSDLGHDGMYVAGGNYPHQEMVQLVGTLHKATQITIPDLLEAFGIFLFHKLNSIRPDFSKGKKTALDYIASVHHVIHVEVRKLYPNAELPTFNVISLKDRRLVIDYSSPREMETLAIGLMKGCAELYDTTLTISQKDISTPEEHTIRFTIQES